MATKKSISLIGLLFTLIALQSMNVTAQVHNCFTEYRPYTPWYENGLVCAGSIVRWRYSPDVQGDCLDWCKSFGTSVGILCAQMNIDDNRNVYCACYSECDPREETLGPLFR
ncbi:hypothetical protein MKX03_020929 [Papaver bracteatum]|nr:hypothetical protein MKX03_020929 [Papaver bracteatum]